MESLFNRNLDHQVTGLKRVLFQSPLTRHVLERVSLLDLPDWYLTSGAVAGTVWNDQHGFAPSYGIKDCDILYFDPDTSYEAEDKFIKAGERLFADLPVPVEIRNQARVHLWLPERFKAAIPPFTSVEDAIPSWSATAICVGVRFDPDSGRFTVFAPYGLNDLWGLILRPVVGYIGTDLATQKYRRWMGQWPRLKLMGDFISAPTQAVLLEPGDQLVTI